MAKAADQISISPEEVLYEVEEILRQKFNPVINKMVYEIKWAGYTETTWETEPNLCACEQKLADFRNRHKVKQEMVDKPKSGTPSQKDDLLLQKFLQKCIAQPNELPKLEEVEGIVGVTDEVSDSLHFVIRLKNEETLLVEKTVCRDKYPGLLCDFLLERVQPIH